MKRKSRNLGAVVVAVAASTIAARAFGDFTQGDLVVLQVGLTGNSTALQSTGTGVQLDEFSTAGEQNAGATIDLPTTASGSNNPLTISGTAGSEGALNLSANGQYLVVAGYDIGVGGTTQGTSTIGLINAAGAVNTSTTTTALSGNNTRSATSIDGTDVWVAGANAIAAVTTGTSGGTAISTRNTRDVIIAPASVSPTGSAQLYSSGSSSSHQGIFSIGSGTPTDGAQSATLLNGMPGGTSPFGFFFANPSTLFVADAALGIQEWTLSAGTWSNTATLAGQFAGLTGVQNGSTVDLFATTATSSGISAQNSLVSDVFTFTSGTTGAGTFGTANTLASAAPFTEFGGVAFAPSSGAGSPPIWNGGGADNNWSTGANWGGTAPAAGALLEFGGTTRLSNNNDIAANTQFGGVQFDAGSGAFVLGGNAINLNGDVVNNSGSTQTVNVNLALQKNVNINAVAGNIAVGGQISGGFSVSGTGNNTVTLSGANSYSGGTNVSAGKVVIGAAGALPANSGVSITGGTLQLAAGTGGETLSSLSITGGSLDIGNNHFILSYAAGTQAAADSTIRGYLTNGRNAGAWNGAGGIDSSGSSGAGVDAGYSVGYADGADHVVTGLSSGQIEVKYTLLGDANLDGLVTGDDFTILVGNLGKAVTGWDKGDFLYTGLVTGDDFTALVGNLGKSASGADVVLPAADYAAIDAFAAANGLTLPSVPEPASAGVLIVAGMGVLARRRRSINA